MMNLDERRDYLKSKTINKKGNLYHDRSFISPILPLPTREVERVEFKNGMAPIIGALSRLVCNKDVKSINKIDVKELINNDDYFHMEEGCELVFEALISSYTSNPDIASIIHPKLMLFLPLTVTQKKTKNQNKTTLKGEAVGEVKAAEFLNQIFFKNIDFKRFFEEESSEKSNILIKFIIDNLNDVSEDTKNNTKYVMSNTLNKVIDVFTEDFNFLLNHKDYLMSNLDLILAFYYFFYLTQLTLKINSNRVSDEIEELYWLLDLESMSKNRIARSRGYKKVDNALRFLLVNEHVFMHTNYLLGTDNLFPSEIIEYVNNWDNEIEKNKFLSVYSDWIEEWRYISGKLENIKLTNKSIEELISIFRETFTVTIDKAPKSRYKEAVKYLGTSYFLKGRGRYGLMLNLSQELLILLTAICIKNGDKISLNDLYSEFEKRGVFLDRNSRDKVVEIFNKLNLIDKKSDSGAVEYVKSIL